MKIGFCFIIRDIIYHENTWIEYFNKRPKNIGEDTYRIYVHRKIKSTKDSNEPSKFVKEHLIKDYAETEWGYIYPAISALYKEAYLDGCDMFILLSESTIPVRDMEDVFSFLKKNGGGQSSFISYVRPPSFFSDIDSKELRETKYLETRKTHATMLRRFANNLERDPNFFAVDVGHWYFQECWSILCRKHVNILLRDRKWLKHFRKAFAYEENYPIYLLSLYNELKNVKNVPTTFVNWMEPEQRARGMQSPKCYKSGDEKHSSIKKLPDTILFARKFDKSFKVSKFREFTKTES